VSRISQRQCRIIVSYRAIRGISASNTTRFTQKIKDGDQDIWSLIRTLGVRISAPDLAEINDFKPGFFESPE